MARVQVRIVRAIGGVAGAATIAAVGLWAGAPAASDNPPPAPAAGIAPSGSDAVRLGENHRIDGAPMQVDVSIVSDPAREAVEWYAQQWRSAGMKPFVTGENNIWHASVFDEKDGLQRSITAIGQPDNSTLLMPSVSNPRRPVDLLNAEKRSPVPVPADSRMYLDDEATDDGTHGYSAQYLTPMSPSAATEFYGREMAAKGWVLSAQTAATKKGPATVTFTKNSAHCEVQASQLDDKKPGSLVFVALDYPEGTTL